MDPDERIELLDAEGIDAVVLYTTIGLLWEAELDDAGAEPGLHRARTTAGSASSAPGNPRLIPTAHLSLSDPAGGGARAGTRRRRRRARRVRRAVHPRRPTARPSRQRSRVRRRARPRRAVRDPSDLRTAVDQGHAHGHLGAREGTAAARVGHGLRRRAPAVHDPVRLRRVRPVPEPEGRGARVGRRLDRLLARPHRRGLRPHLHRYPRAACSTSPATTSANACGSPAIPTNARSRRSPSGSAPTGSCGPPTSPTPTTRPSTSPTSTSSPPSSTKRARRQFLGDNARSLYRITVKAGPGSAGANDLTRDFTVFEEFEKLRRGQLAGIGVVRIAAVA